MKKSFMSKVYQVIWLYSAIFCIGAIGSYNPLWMDVSFFLVGIFLLSYFIMEINK